MKLPRLPKVRRPRDAREWIIAGALGAGVLALAGAAFGGPRVRGRIRAPGLDYAMTDDDLLWLARATRCEAGSHAREHIWLMLQRFVAQRQQGHDWTLGYAVQAFSSPVNPRWLPGGSKYQEHPTWRAAGPEAQSLRERCMHYSWESIERARPDVYDEIQKVAAGTSRNPVPGYTNFAACWATSGVPYGGNCFIRNDPPLRGTVRLG